MAQCILKSSLVGKLEIDVEIKAPAKKFYNMFASTPQNVPKAIPDHIQRCNIQEGEPGKVGSIISWNYVMDGQPQVAKERIETLEPEKNLICFRVIEGDIMKEFKNFLITMQVTPKQVGPGSVVKFVTKYEKIDENVAHPENLLALFAKATKDIDAILLSQV